MKKKKIRSTTSEKRKFINSCSTESSSTTEKYNNRTKSWWKTETAPQSHSHKKKKKKKQTNCQRIIDKLLIITRNRKKHLFFKHNYKKNCWIFIKIVILRNLKSLNLIALPKSIPEVFGFFISLLTKLDVVFFFPTNFIANQLLDSDIHRTVMLNQFLSNDVKDSRFPLGLNLLDWRKREIE